MTTSYVLDALATSRRIADHYQGYLCSTFSPRRPELKREFEAALSGALPLVKGPFLQASPPFVNGSSLRALVDEGLISKGFSRLRPEAFPLDRPLYLHQEQAVRKAVGGGRNLAIATGTGSGKTECFLLPIMNHLLREKEIGTLAQPGVRALLLYPMNALANDQVKRLRQLLADFPEITFGRYVGETQSSQVRAEADFRARYPSEPRLSNELISREEMQATPPDILLTNYAMLEYLLLRPADSTLFDSPTGGHWRFVVLDEAHVYSGAQGTEVAMLLRRVRDRVLRSERGKLQCFATSATLGRGEADYPALIDFATALFDEEFVWDADEPQRQDIVSALRKPLVRTDAAYELPQSMYPDLQRAYRSGADALELSEIAAAGGHLAGDIPTTTPAAFLTELLGLDRHVVALQSMLEKGSIELAAAAKRLFVGPAAAPELVALIDLCVAARHRDDDAPLIPARYHFFLRALEGAFVCLHPGHNQDDPKLLLSRHEQCPSCARQGRTAAMFELGVCRNCSAEYLVGELTEHGNGHVLSTSADFAVRRRYLLLGDAVTDDDEDEVATGVQGASSTESGLLCPGCGMVSQDGPPACDCAERPQPVRVTVVVLPGDSPLLRTCLACSSRTSGEIVTRFVTGTDAPVAVVATDLYQELPRSADGRLAERVGEGRKLLMFSDSRQDAAFFAPYLERTYRRAVQRRLIAGAVAELNKIGTPRSDDLILSIRREAERCLVLDPDEGMLANNGEVSAWIAEELLALDRRQSLEGTGTAEITVAFPRQYQAPRPLLAAGFEEAQVEDLLRLLLDTIRRGGAMTTPEGVDIRDERFAPRNFEFGLRETGSETGVITWLPGSAMNLRLEILAKALTAKGSSANPQELLVGIWRYLTNRDGPWSNVLVSLSDAKKGALWQLSYKRFEFLPATDAHRPLRCDTCQRVWWRTVAGICPTWKCSGTVRPIEDLKALLSDHYARLYGRLSPIGIDVQEHTAQWTAAKASSIQDDFVNGRINVLSCSTTFELGVDVGEVQAVLLRNVPPTAANYVQRAGRAGRRTDSAALVVTFAQRRSHDLTHFDDPRPLVDGVIAPPVIFLDNAAIVRRHAHSIAFAAFERMSAASGDGHATVEDFFSSKGSQQPADGAFVGWLRTHPASVGDALRRVVPEETAPRLGLDSWSWVDALVEPSPDEPTHGWLTRAGEEIRDELHTVDDLIDEAYADKKAPQAGHFERLRRTLAGRFLLGFLASRNVLPKYGFPVDVVDLKLTGSGDPDAANLELDRDLKLAISDYAPGAMVVAAKTVWTSVGLGVRSNHSLPTHKWGVCRDCGAFRHHLEELAPTCGVCGSDTLAPGKAGTFVLPIFGFVGKRHSKPGESRPIRMAVTETYFGTYQGEEPALQPIPELSSYCRVERRSSRQGRISVINRGPFGRGFRICDWCGFGEPAPASTKKKLPPHEDIRRPGKECNGHLAFRHLGHEYLTDVTEVRLSLPMSEEDARSTLYALLEGTARLSIARDNVDGTLYRFSSADPPAFIIFDTVPGGAGHAQRIADNFPAVFAGAFDRVNECECGLETSCYSCLRSYSNQLWHSTLTRGGAARVLSAVLGGDTSKPAKGDLSLLSPEARSLVEAVMGLGAPMPVPGWEVEADGQVWPVEAGWPEKKVAVLVYANSTRDAWLSDHDWDARPVSSWTPAALVNALNQRL
jgi:ATP-dependent helicase YprA (DUF1998 family)